MCTKYITYSWEWFDEKNTKKNFIIRTFRCVDDARKVAIQTFLGDSIAYRCIMQNEPKIIEALKSD